MSKDNIFAGRLKGMKSKKTSKYISSLQEDKQIVEIDIDVIEAQDHMLNEQGYITTEDLGKIIFGLEVAREKWLKGELDKEFDEDMVSLIDIHPVVEMMVINLFGMEIGGKTHLAKSRNDQVMTDVRIKVRNNILELLDAFVEFLKTLVKQIEESKETIMPGYTHTQHGQVTTFGYYLMSYAKVFLRVTDRLFESYNRVNLNPLGSCALVGTTININRYRTTELLGFDDIIENTMDGVSNRDFALEVSAILSGLMISLSRLAEDLINWSTFEVGMVEIADEFCDTSTAMPQKKNPDVLEMLRGKTARTIGSYSFLASMEKNLPTGYNKDLQETKVALWSDFEVAIDSVKIMGEIINTLKLNKDRMLELANSNYSTAVDLAEYFVHTHDISFREAHLIVGEIVNKLQPEKRLFNDLTTKEIAEISKKILGKEIILHNEDFRNFTNPVYSVINRTNVDGPAPVNIQKGIKHLKILIGEREEKLSLKKKKVQQAKLKLQRLNQKIISDVFKQKKMQELVFKDETSKQLLKTYL